MLDKTIISALCQLRLQLIRSGTDLRHVDALLRQRGISPKALHVPTAPPADSCARGEIRLFVLALLRDGPRRAVDVAAAFHAKYPDLSYETARRRVYRAGDKMVAKGQMIRAG